VFHVARGRPEGTDHDPGDSRDSPHRGRAAAGKPRSELPDLLTQRQLPVADLAQRLGVKKVRFKSVLQPVPVDESSPSLVRDPNKCVLCGDCVRMCWEIQGIGAIDFAHRGHEACVQPAFGKPLGEVECVNCGQCASVCPTGALTVKSEEDAVWNLLADPTKKVVVQIAPAVRVAWASASAASPERSPPDRSSPP